MSLETDPNRSMLRNWRIGIQYNANLIQMALLLVAFALLIVVAFWGIWGATGVLVALLVVAAGTALALRLKPESVMRIYGARPPESGTQTQAIGLAAELSHRAQLVRTPHIFVIPSGLLSAFSAGTSERSCIAVTEGVLRQLTMREIADVTPEVEQILPELDPIPVPVWLATHRELNTSRRIRLVYDLLAEALA